MYIESHYGSSWVPMEYHYDLSACVKVLYMNYSCCVKMESGTTDYFQIDTGVRQGYILSPFLFLLAMDFTMKTQWMTKTAASGGIGEYVLWILTLQLMLPF